jgi:hypothetical protein
MKKSSHLLSAMALASVAGALGSKMLGGAMFQGPHAGGVIWQPFNMSSIMKARRENQRAKNQKRMRGFKH